MRVSRFTGIITIACPCGQEFVVDSEKVKNGFRFQCKCGQCCHVNRWASVELHIKPIQFSEHWDTAVKAAYRKPVGEAITIEEYRMHLADSIIAGKVPKINTKHKNVVSIDMSDKQVVDAYEALRALGYRKTEAMSRVAEAVSLKTGLTRTELLEAILSS